MRASEAALNQGPVPASDQEHYHRVCQTRELGMLHAECRQFWPLETMSVHTMTSAVHNFEGGAANETQVKRPVQRISPEAVHCRGAVKRVPRLVGNVNRYAKHCVGCIAEVEDALELGIATKFGRRVLIESTTLDVLDGAS